MTAARVGGDINMDQQESVIRRQVMWKAQPFNQQELKNLDAKTSVIQFATTKDERLLTVMRQEEFYEAKSWTSGQTRAQYPT